MEMHPYSYLRRPSPSSIRNLYQQHYPPVESVPAIWQQRQTVSELDGIMLSSHRRVLPEGDMNETNNGSMRGAGIECSSRIMPPALLGRSCGSLPGAQSSSSSELYDSIGSTTQFVDSSDARPYSLLRRPSAMSVASSNVEEQQQTSAGVGGGAGLEGPTIGELIRNLGGTDSGRFLASVPSPCQQLNSERGTGDDGLAEAQVKFRGTAGNHCWNSPANVTEGVEVLPTNTVGGGLSNDTRDPGFKGALPLNHVGAVVAAGGLATCHRPSPFTADPGFAERAARFSSFSNLDGNPALQIFPSDSESVGLARPRMARSGASQPSPRNSSYLPLQQETAEAPAISNDSVPSDCRLPAESRTVHEIQSGSTRAVFVDLVASAATPNSDDGRTTLNQHNAQADWNPAPGEHSRSRVSAMMASASNAEKEGLQELQRNVSVDESCDRTQATSLTVSEQVISAGPGEPPPSPSSRSGPSDISVKKRKPIFDEWPLSKHVGSGSAFPHHDADAKTTETDEAKAKRIRRRDGKGDVSCKGERASSETSGESSPRSTKEHNSKPLSDHPKTDYIHVRARRGQATDSHSLAERVRREKISERMKFLQDLVPGCSKVTGKAVMLDEIINYVQSLQRQVEFLSMKLASVNPRLDLRNERFLAKEGRHPVSQAAVLLNAETSVAYPPLQPLKHRTPLPQPGLGLQFHTEAAVARSMSAMPIGSATIPRMDNFEDGVRQIMWHDGDSDLNSVVQMGFANSQPATTSQGLHCHLPSSGQVKVELQQSPITCL